MQIIPFFWMRTRALLREALVFSMPQGECFDRDDEEEGKARRRGREGGGAKGGHAGTQDR